MSKQENKKCQCCQAEVSDGRKKSFCSDVCEKDWYTAKKNKRVLLEMLSYEGGDQ